jgi:putative hydrolase of the HAD superfamily
MRWLLCDYGEVLCLPPSQPDQEALEAEAGSGGPRFWAPYWQHRPGYDRGQLDTVTYWTRVFGRAPRASHVQRLHETDTIMWSRPNQSSIDAAQRTAALGLRLAVLSNAPAELADRFDRLPWLDPFAPRLFSGRLGMVKPEPAIFVAALEALDARPGDVIFVDDRPENVEAALRLGLRATLFTRPGQLDVTHQLTASRGPWVPRTASARSGLSVRGDERPG